MKTSYPMRLSSLIILLCLSGLSTIAQNYTWMKGSNLLDQGGTYGTMGVPAASNNPGAREGAMQWKDASGNFWLFGGNGYDASSTLSFLNDLWKYDPVSNQWTWISGTSSVDDPGVYGTIGVPASTNKPGARVEGLSWTDAAGNLWLYGGVGIDGTSSMGFLSDLWMYNISTNLWTWVKGPSTVNQNGVYGTISVAAAANFPGGRVGSAGWADNSGNLWLFGGVGLDNSSSSFDYLNDLWRYNIATNQWTWMKGSNTQFQNGTYGTINVAAAANSPGSRYSSRGAVDASGNFWLFGGEGLDASSGFGDLLNDLWRYNPTTNQWTWMKGSSTSGQTGVYGTMGVPAAANAPGGRFGFTAIMDGTNNFWIFGGNALDNSSSFSDQINDLWSYNIGTNQWTWMKGSNTQAQAGTYGTQGVAAPANTPGARGFTSGWLGTANSLWFFGGSGYDSNQSFGHFNDMWKFSTCIAAPVNIVSTNTNICAGNSVTLTASGASSYTWSTTQQTVSIVVSPVITTTYVVQTTDGNGCTNQASIVQSVSPQPTITIASSNSLICSGSNATLTASGGQNYSWAPGGTSSITIAPSATTVYTVSGVNNAGCSGTASFTQDVAPNPTISITSTKNTLCVGESGTITVTGATSYSWHGSSNTSNTLVVAPSTQTVITITGTDGNGCKHTAAFTQSTSACAGISVKKADALFRLYPNPNNGVFTIELGESSEDQQIIIYNAIGQKVFSQQITPQNNAVHTTLGKGVYFYQAVRGNNIHQTGKLVVE